MAEEMRIVLRNLGKVDPLNVDTYIQAGGYQALAKAKSMSQTDLIEEVKRPGFRSG
jgi:NADH:ubiquinone oxidoreductase subunit F (NADH-binding)